MLFKLDLLLKERKWAHIFNKGRFFETQLAQWSQSRVRSSRLFEMDAHNQRSSFVKFPYISEYNGCIQLSLQNRTSRMYFNNLLQLLNFSLYKSSDFYGVRLQCKHILNLYFPTKKFSNNFIYSHISYGIWYFSLHICVCVCVIFPWSYRYKIWVDLCYNFTTSLNLLYPPEKVKDENFCHSLASQCKILTPNQNLTGQLEWFSTKLYTPRLPTIPRCR